jgi:murein L,D-transpeptidase YcbB/YkuD
LFLLAVLITGCAREQIDNSRHVAAIQKIVSSSPSWVEHDKLGAKLWDSEEAFYRSRGNLPAWIDGDRRTPELDALIEELRHAGDHGLDPARYGTGQFQKAIEAADANKGRFDLAGVPEIDARLTYAYLRYAADVLGWTGNPKAIYAQWVVKSKQDDLAARLSKAISSHEIRESLQELAPTHQQYKGLQAALARERKTPTGHLDQIRMNLERWRWMPRQLGDRYILVNVPAYQMQVMEGEKPALAMRVIVGQPKNPTPLFSDEMTNVVFSPTWNIPESIIRNEMVPHQVNDPSYLERHDIEVVGTSGDAVDLASVDWDDERSVSGMHFRQAPGPQNALGLVKFIFPNDFDVYLHDTPTDSLFNKTHRALSHGCVRVENPVALAQYVMRDRPEWTPETIAAAMNAQREQAVPLKKHLPVHIGYWTAWVNPDGSVTYTDDPYKLDEKQAAVEHLGVPSVAKTAAVERRRTGQIGSAVGTPENARTAAYGR